MTLSFRYRTGLVLAGLVMGAPLLASTGAFADTTQTITFSGQPLLGAALSCPSTPSVTTLTVTSGTTVDFVNRTGKQATLWAGDAEKSLPDRSLVPVTFNGGSSSVVIQMIPDCALDLGKHVQMTVTVEAPAAGNTAPAATPTPLPGTGTSSGGSRSGTPSSPTTARTSGAGPAASKSAGAGSGTTGTGSGDNNPFQQQPASTVVAAKPVIGAAVVSSEPRSASGLLTLIATVGVVGVSAAAIRAIVAQRAMRTVNV
jgi:hypothetical protein